jgi:hypothetical protein
VIQVKIAVIRRDWWLGSMLLLSLVVVVLFSLEFYGKIFERGIGNYLKWQNSTRSQLGRVWDKDRQTVLAQAKVQSIRSLLDSRQESAEAIDSLKALFENTEPSFPLVLSREKFLDLYYDFPGQWSTRMISPFELISIDSKYNWTRVLLKRFGQWFTINFLDSHNIPVHEVFVASDALQEVQATRTVKQGSLEEVGFKKDRIFSVAVFLPLLKALDPKTQQAVFPDPRWFLAKDYSITRIGVRELESFKKIEPRLEFGIEYNTDYNSGVLLIPVSQDIANNLLSQIERTNFDIWGEAFSSLAVPSIGDNP